MIYSHGAPTGRVTQDEIQQSRFADAMIVLNTRMCTAQNQRDTIADLRRANIPFVMVNAYSGRDSINYVGMDDYQAGWLAGSTLTERGHKRIAVISGARKSPMSLTLLRGLKAGMAKSGGTLDPNLHVFSEYNKGVILASLNTWLSRKDMPTAIFCGDDQFVPQVYAALQAKKLRIPNDVAVLGRGNLSLGTAIVPQLTTIDVPGHEMGRSAAELVLKVLESKTRPPERIILPCGLIERHSL
jgi:LacI family transcriptional regulator